MKVIIPVLLAVIFLFFALQFMDNGYSSVRKFVLAQKFRGRIDSIYYDHRGSLKIHLKRGGTESIRSSSFTENVFKGDSIVKDSGQVYYKVFKAADTFICYPDIRGNHIWK